MVKKKSKKLLSQLLSFSLSDKRRADTLNSKIRLGRAKSYLHAFGRKFSGLFLNSGF